MTDQDFSKLRGIIKEEINIALEEKLETKLEEKLDQKLKPIVKRLDKMQKDLTTTISFFGGEIIDHEKRIKRIESHLNISTVL